MKTENHNPKFNWSLGIGHWSFKKAFSLVELLVVITIIAILSVVAYTAVGGQTVKARDARRTQDLATLQNALELYFIQNGSYPTPKTAIVYNDGTDRTYNYIDSTILTQKYITKIPVDPKIYVNPTTKMEYQMQYQYNVNGKMYQLAATLETEGTAPKAYVVGNYVKSVPADPDSLIIDAETPANKVTDGDTVDLPYRW